MSRTSRLLIGTAAALLLTLAAAAAVAAQSPAQRERERRERENRERDAEFDLLMTDDLRRRAPERRPQRQNLTQIREDYVRLQVRTTTSRRAWPPPRPTRST